MSLNMSLEERILEMLTLFVDKREPKQVEKHKDDDITPYKRRFNKAQTENFTVVNSLRIDEKYGYQYYVKTKNEKIYNVLIGKNISCTCADHRFRTLHCKHILFILHEQIQADLSSAIYSTLRPDEKLLDQIFTNYQPPL